jgi:alkylation response protein AidB-like acyl-CoA dehydrogenase
MDFDDTPEEAAYREKVRAWLAQNAPKERRLAGAVDEDLPRAKAWQKKKAAAGYAQIAWPKEWNGGGGTVLQSVIYNQEEAKAGVSLGAPFEIGLGMCIPTIMAVGDEATKQRVVGPAVRGDEIWCQLFSEPSSGSDLAAIRTRAVRDGDMWVVNGQKIWTSGAHYSDFGLLLARTNPGAVKHKGLTMFWIDMKAPGIEVRPIHQMSGASDFNEVFFTDLRIKDSQRLGAIDDGWKVSLVTLMNERAAIGGSLRGNRWSTAEAVMGLAAGITGLDGRPSLENQGLREKLADWYVQAEGLRLTGMRSLTALSRGEIPGPENSISKVVMANMAQDLADQALELQDQFGIISDPVIAPGQAMFQLAVLGVPGLRIAGGTDEILRNIIAERVLGLPGEIRVDKDIPFKDLPQGF